MADRLAPAKVTTKEVDLAAQVEQRLDAGLLVGLAHGGHDGHLEQRVDE